jgi:hypothetical protein
MFGWIDRVWHSATGKIDSTIANWVHGLIHGLYSFLSLIFGPVGDAWSQLSKDVYDWLKEHADWTITVAHAIEDAYRWINKEGYEVYHYISHPSLLVDLLWDANVAKLETEAWDVGEKLGKFFLSLIYKNLKKFVLLIEDIFDAVF